MSLDNEINNISILDLESQFSKDLSSSLFVVLAQKYFEVRDYKRAKSVCEIGLINHPSNIMGKLIQAKTYLCLNELFKAENLLIDILSFSPNAINPLKLLVEVQLQLGRNIKKIEKYIRKLIILIPNNEYYSKLINDKKETVKKIKQRNHLAPLSYVVDDNMATFAFYNVVKSQRSYQLAYNILLSIEKKTGQSPKINEEKRVLNDLLEKSK